uniref:Ski2 N-terminal domain-containing protein n=1 Tax=Plectus sambesii TaxID=2011161 RepID=A0A914VGU7_9BILA
MASTTTTGEEVGKLLEDLLVAEADRVFCESARALLLQTDEYDERKTWRFSKPENDKKSLVFELLKPSEATTTFEAERDLRTGAVMGVKEVACQSGGGTARSSMSLLRAPDSVAPNRLMGSATNVPFLP